MRKKTATILVIDDEPYVCQGLDLTLHLHYNVVQATSTTEAFAVLTNQERLGDPIKAIVCDYHMPMMDGLEFLAYIKDHYPNIVRILMTGHATLQLAVNAVNLGVLHKFLVKPVDPPDLLSALRLTLALKANR